MNGRWRRAVFTAFMVTVAVVITGGVVRDIAAVFRSNGLPLWAYFPFGAVISVTVGFIVGKTVDTVRREKGDTWKKDVSSLHSARSTKACSPPH